MCPEEQKLYFIQWLLLKHFARPWRVGAHRAFDKEEGSPKAKPDIVPVFSVKLFPEDPEPRGEAGFLKGVDSWAGLVLKRICHWEEEGKEGRAPPHRPAHSKVDLCEPFRTDLLSELQGLPWAISLPVKVPSSGCFEGTGGKEANGMKMQETEQRNLSEITQEPNRDKMGTRVFHPLYLC